MVTRDWEVRAVAQRGEEESGELRSDHNSYGAVRFCGAAEPTCGAFLFPEGT